jgi:hypothetical protein
MRLARDLNVDVLETDAKTKIPVVDLTVNFPSIGAIAFSHGSLTPFYGNGTGWVPFGSASALPAPLQSIANLVTTSNEMLYTTAANTYAVTAASAFGRSLLASANQAALLGTLDAIGGGSSLTSVTSVPVVSATGVLNQSVVSIDGLGNVTGANNIIVSSGFQIDNLPDFTRYDIGGITQFVNGGGQTTVFFEPPTAANALLFPDKSGTLATLGDIGASTWGAITGTLSNQLDLQAALDGKVDENAAIIGAVKTKITYDAKGLVTSGADATTADIADSTNRRYVTDAQSTVIGNTSGTNTGDNATNTTSNAYADGKVEDNLTASTTVAPSKTAVNPITATFNGNNISLQRISGTLYAAYTQVAIINFSLDGIAALGGYATLRLTANGNAINVDAAWRNVGTDVVTPTNGLIHRFIFFRENSEVWYTVKVGVV